MKMNHTNADAAKTPRNNLEELQQKYQNEAAPIVKFKDIIGQVESLAASARTWKERKEIENRKVFKLGGKTQKQQRLPLSVARLQMKNQKAREDQMLKERLMYGQHGGMLSTVSKRTPEKRKPEERVLKSTVGRFRNGVLDVKHMLKSGPSREDPSASSHVGHKGKKGGGKKKKGGGKQKKGKQNGGGRNRR